MLGSILTVAHVWTEDYDQPLVEAAHSGPIVQHGDDHVSTDDEKIAVLRNNDIDKARALRLLDELPAGFAKDAQTTLTPILRYFCTIRAVKSSLVSARSGQSFLAASYHPC